MADIKKQKVHNKSLRSIVLAASVSALIAITMFITLFCYQHYTVENTRNDTFQVLLDYAAGQKSVFSSVLSGMFSVLNIIDTDRQPDITDMQDKLNDVVSSGLFCNVGIASSDGRAYMNDGQNTDVSAQEFFIRASEGERAVTFCGAGVFTDSPLIVVSLPVYKSDKLSAVIFAGLDETILRRFAASSDSQAPFFICDKNGNVIFSSADSEYSGQGGNFFDYISENGSFGSENDRKTAVENMNTGRNGTFYFVSGGYGHYASYIPLDQNEWYIFYTVPASAVDAQADNTVHTGILSIILLSIFATLIVLFVVYINSKSLRQLELERERFRLGEERYHIMDDFTESIVFEGDYGTDKINFNDQYMKLYNREPYLPTVSSFGREHPYVLPDDMQEFLKTGTDIIAGTAYTMGEYRIILPSGALAWHRLEARTVFDDQGCPKKVIGRIINIDTQMKRLESLSIKAHTDPLTGLLNRASIEEYVTNYILGDGINDWSALFIIDVDFFKQVNDRFGHLEGDELLKKVGEIAKKLFRDTDYISRIGGDEFLVLMKNFQSLSDVKLKASLLCNSLSFEYAKGGVISNITCSVGVALCHGGDHDFNSLYKRADVALYAAKERGRNCYVILTGDGEESGSGSGGQPMHLSLKKAANANVQLGALLEYMDGGVILFEIGNEITTLYISPSYFSVFKRSQADGTNPVFSYIFPQDLPELQNALKNGSRGREVVEITYRAVQEDGATGWRHMRAVRIPFKGADNPVMIAVITDITALQKTSRQLKEDKEKLTLAIDQTALQVWEFDITSKKLTMIGSGAVISNLPESSISSGKVHPDSVAEYRLFFSKMSSGAPSGTCVVMMRTDSEYEWYKISFRTVTDPEKEDSARKAIGITDPMPHIKEQKRNFETAGKYAKAIIPHCLYTFFIDLTLNQIRGCICNNGASVLSVNAANYEEFIDYICNEMADQDDIHSMRARFDRELLLLSYEQGIRYTTLQYRRREQDGRIRWTVCSCVLIMDPATGDVYTAGYIRDIDSRHRRELSIDRRAELDPSTKLYNSETTEALACQALADDRAPGSRCAIAIIEIDGLDHLHENVGPTAQSELLDFFGRGLRVLLDSKYIVGSCAHNKAVIFFTSVQSAQWATNQVSEAIEQLRELRRNTSGSEHMNLLVGIAVTRSETARYRRMLEQAEFSLSQYKRSYAANTISYDDEAQKSPAGALSQDASSAVADNNGLGSADAEENAALAQCLTVLITEASVSGAIMSVLSVIGEYYAAERVYILYLSSSQDTLDGGEEWIQTGVEPFASTVSGEDVNKFPLVSACIEKRCTLVIGNASDEKDGSRFIIAPMLFNEKICGFVCVDDPRENQFNSRLASSAAGCIIAQSYRRDCEQKTTSARYTDLLTNVYNRARYIADIMKLDGAVLTALGVVYADINGLSRLNRDVDVEYGDSAIKYAARLLTESFHHENVYRISADEFVVLSRDLMYNTFSSHAKMVKHLFSERYPQGISMGYTWADRDIKPEKLVEHAEELMKIEKQNYYRSEEMAGVRRRPEALNELMKNISESRFVVYLQPKADVHTREIVGAEALVRLVDPNRGIVPPAAFIPKYENENIISYLDLYILEQTLGVISKWLESGRKAIPVSVNFSRSTLLDTGILNNVNEIVKRSGVPRNLLEIEITESIGSVERATVAAACKRFTEAEYSLALDDFGCEYSSFSILSAIRFSVLKIDKSIVNDIASNKASRVILENSVRTGHTLGMLSIAEGVETEEQLQVLKQTGCDQAQGYLFNKPLPIEDFETKYLK